jgi:hypothetical protein
MLTVSMHESGEEIVDIQSPAGYEGAGEGRCLKGVISTLAGLQVMHTTPDHAGYFF